MNYYMYIFVEGSTDSLFITKLFAEKLSLFGENYNVIEYAKKKDEKTNNYIKSIKSMPNSDYIFISDQDGNKNKKEKRLTQYCYLEEDKVFISIYEIESWIAAGISDKLSKRYKIKPIISDTSSITKEKFDQMIPSQMSKIDFISYILEDYNLGKAMERNVSLKLFFEYLKEKAS